MSDDVRSILPDLTPLSAGFFARPTLKVARDLLGALLVHEHPSGRRLAGRVVETEGYTEGDPAFHGWNALDPETGQLRTDGRAADLFVAPGTAYVYLFYGRYWLLNVVTEPEGTGGAVLVRAVEPVAGRALMHELRPNVTADVDLTNGPGKLTQAFDLDGDDHGADLTAPPIYFAMPDGGPPDDWRIATSSRIGLTKGIERPWRFFVAGHPYVSKGTPSDQR
jgi:DNA-3-methyladenine glycosylase